MLGFTKENKTLAKEDNAKEKQVSAGTPGTGVAVTGGGGGDMPAFLFEEAKKDTGKGVSTAQEDNLVPLIYVLQSNSPQVNKRDEKYVEGAEAGHLWLRNAPIQIVNGEEGVLFQPCYFMRDVGEWIPRDPDGGGGGFIGRHAKMPEDMEEVEDSKNPNRKRFMSPRGTEYVETRNHAGFIIHPSFTMPFNIALTSTGHSVSRAWMGLMNAKKLDNGDIIPSWAALYRLKTRLRTRGAQNWFVLDVSDATQAPNITWVDALGYKRGKQLHEDFARGAKQMAAPDSGGDSGGGSGVDDNIPF